MIYKKQKMINIMIIQKELYFNSISRIRSTIFGHKRGVIYLLKLIF